MDIIDSYYTNLHTIGRDEKWLQAWIEEDPSRLGLGNIVIKKSELTQYQNKGGRLDILGYKADVDTYYEIELMLGECDASHEFRVLDYWAREQVSRPNSRHYAVLVAEDLSGRYKTLIDLLPNHLPFIGIEIRVLRFKGQDNLATLQSVIVSQPDDLLIDDGDEPKVNGSAQPRDREWWENKAGTVFLNTVDSLAKLASENCGPSRLDYSAQSYVSLKKGRRCWLPMWPRTGGVYVYIPGGGNGSADEPSEFYVRT